MGAQDAEPEPRDTSGRHTRMLSQPACGADDPCRVSYTLFGMSLPRLGCGLFVLLLVASRAQQKAPATGTPGPAKAPPAAAPARATTTAAPKTKAIWEPVNVKDDLKLLSIRFVSPDEGWAAGGRDELHGGVILHTKDGGATWEAQLGNSKSNEPAYTDLRMLSATTGWATQGSPGGQDKLLRTNDGHSWAQVGGLPQRHLAYTFTSENNGFVLYGRQILRSLDGGRNWRSAYRCSVKYAVKGVAQESFCEFESISFLNDAVGFALSREIDRGAGSVLARTMDGGTTWDASVILPGQNGKESSIWFTTERHGLIRMSDGKLFYTDDGGKAWTAAAGLADGRPEVQFAGANVGWAVRNRAMTYTTDGGKHWLTRLLPFLGIVSAASLVSPERGYVAGEHGIVYRYRVAPLNYVSKGMLPAPAL